MVAFVSGLRKSAGRYGWISTKARVSVPLWSCWWATQRTSIRASERGGPTDGARRRCQRRPMGPASVLWRSGALMRPPPPPPTTTNNPVLQYLLFIDVLFAIRPASAASIRQILGVHLSARPSASGDDRRRRLVLRPQRASVCFPSVLPSLDGDAGELTRGSRLCKCSTPEDQIPSSAVFVSQCAARLGR